MEQRNITICPLITKGVENMLKSVKFVLLILLSLYLATLNSAANVSAVTSTPASVLIPLTADKIHDEVIAFYDTTYITRASVLVDEQNKVPKILTGKLTQTLDPSIWIPAMKGEYSPVSCYVDLGTEFKITGIGYYDTYGVNTIEFSKGTPTHWISLATRLTDSYLNWSTIDFSATDVTTRYLQIKSTDNCYSGIAEIAIYGYQVGANPVVKPDTSNIKPNFNITADKQIGINAFIDDPLNAMEVAGTVREYHDISWNGTDGSKLEFNPTAAGGGWNFDDYYSSLKNAGVDVFPCIKGNANWMLHNPSDSYLLASNKPIQRGANSTSPASYYDHASVMYQYAARYGSTVVPTSTLKLADNQVKKTGLGLLSYYENGNEQNENWDGKDSYFSPYELAAMTSADYDGHEGTLGKDAGIKNADKNAKLVLGGLVGGGDLVTTYLDLMKTWFENNRTDKKFAADVLNFHQYLGKLSPEAAGMKASLSTIVKWRNKNTPDKELWLTEFGWDTNNTSDIAAPSQEAQADWLVRGYLASMAAGIDRTTMYMLRDAAPWNYGNYGSSGLVGEKGNWAPKTSWFYVYAMKGTLKDMYFDSVVLESPTVYVYKFKSKLYGNSKECYVAWSPTSNGTTVANYKLNVNNKTKATLVQLSDDYSDGLKNTIAISNSTVSINVSERPQFIVVTDNTVNEVILPTLAKIPVTVANTYSSTPEASTQFSHLFDEQATVPRGFNGLLRSNFSTNFGTVYPLSLFPLSDYIDLGQTYRITNIGFFDSTGTGKISFTGGKPSNWNDKSSLDYDFGAYNNWIVKDTDVTTRYIKIDKFDNSDCYELGFYGYPVSSADDKITTSFPALMAIDKQTELTKLGLTGTDLIPISPSSVYGNKNYVGSFKSLVDEQALVPSKSTLPLQNNLTSPWINLWNLPTPICRYIDLGAYYNVSNIAFYDTTGVEPFVFYSGQPGSWTPVLTSNLDSYLSSTTNLW